jgi:hypothetical protein
VIIIDVVIICRHTAYQLEMIRQLDQQIKIFRTFAILHFYKKLYFHKYDDCLAHTNSCGHLVGLGRIEDRDVILVSK